jgi:hypothetical protein
MGGRKVSSAPRFSPAKTAASGVAGVRVAKIWASSGLTVSRVSGVSEELTMARRRVNAPSGLGKDATKPRLPAMGAGKVRKFKRMMTASVPSEPMRSL